MTTDSPQLSPADPRAHVPALARMFEALTQDELRSLMYLVHERAGLELPLSLIHISEPTRPY